METHEKISEKVPSSRINVTHSFLSHINDPFLQQLEVHCLFERATLDLADNTAFFQLQRYSLRYGAVSSLLSVFL